MIFSVQQKEFIKALEEVYKAIDPINYYLPLRNFYICIKEEKVIINGTNGKLSIEKVLDKNNLVEISNQNLNLLISSNLFLNIVRKCSGIISFQLKNPTTLIIINENDIYEINLLDPNDYPPIDFNLYGSKINVNVKKLKEAIDNVIFATSQKDEDYILNGVNLKLDNGELIVCATDSYRLAEERIKINDDRNLNFDVTIFNRNLKNFIPANVENEDVTLYVNDHKINLIYRGFNIQSAIIDAIYKDVSRLFKISYSKKITIDKTTLNNAIAKAVVISGDVYNKIKIEISQDEIKLISAKDEVGNSKVVIKNTHFEYEGEPTTMTFNFKYLKEAIGVFSDKIQIHMNNPEDIIMITSENSTNRQIVCPLKSH